MTATEASRNFSDLLNRVASGEEIELTRSGARVAVVSPRKPELVSAERLLEILNGAPPVDQGYAEELRELRSSVGPPADRWR